MANTLSVNQMKAGVGWDYETTLPYGNNLQVNSYTYSKVLANGSGLGFASKIAVVQADGSTGGAAALVASGTVTYDLTAMTDPFGAAVSFSKVRIIYLENFSAAATTTINAGGGTNPWVGAAQPLNGTTPTVRIPSAGVWFLANNTAAGFTVDGTHKTLVITNEDGSNPAQYKLCIVGE